MRILWLLAALAGCAGASPGSNNVAAPGPGPGPAPALSEEYRAMVESVERRFREPGVVTARLNEEVAVGAVRVRPLAILEDTRCPIDVDCVHGGNLRLRVAVSGLGETEMDIWRPLPIPGGQALRLNVVAPPRWSRPPPPGIDPNEAPRFGFSRVAGN
ncbi:MAG TPA: hypothetical protein VMG08_16620 [Allosphingosinicella sp.]|nr:hypothetical protein [Allosphingosinicella sp.]